MSKCKEKNKDKEKVNNTTEEEVIDKEHECCCDCHCSDDNECNCGDECSCEEDNHLMDMISELQNKLMYKEAEFVNYRRRKDEETSNMLKYANQDLILDIIKSVDNFERAIISIKNDDEKDNQKMLTGIEMIYNELVSTLKKYGVEEINDVDCKFDHNIHNAVMTDSVSDKENDIVLEILVKGYKLKDRVIRPAMVKVNNI